MKWKAPLLCAALYIGAFLLEASVLRHVFGFPLDDSWIHEVVARNFAETGVLGFWPGTLSSGSTSLLWTLILTLRALLFPALSPVIYSLALSVVFLAGIGFSLKRLTESDSVPPAVSWCLALAPAASGNILWLGLIGMEHLLFILLTVLAIGAWFQAPGRGPRHDWLLAASCFLLVLTRPEGICLVALMYLFREGAGRTAGEWWRAAVAGGLAAAISAAVNLVTGHHLTPLTMQGRNGAVGQAGWLAKRVDFAEHVGARLLSVWGITGPEHLLHGKGSLVGVLLLGAATLCCAAALRQLARLPAPRMLLLCAWGGVILVLYALLLPTPGHSGRYISLPLFLFLPLVCAGLGFLLVAVARRERRAWAAVAAFGAITAAVSIHSWRIAAVDDITQINEEHGAMATWMLLHLPPRAITDREIAIYDIGRMGYALHGNLVDLGGLVDYRFHRYLVEGQTAAYLREHAVRYVVLASSAVPGDLGFSSVLALDAAHGVTLTPLHAVCADAAIARTAFSASETALPCQRLFAVSWRAQAPEPTATN